jgi:hypothetical protein
MLDSRGGGGESASYGEESPAEEYSAAGAGRGGSGRSERRPPVQDLDDEIPF